MHTTLFEYRDGETICEAFVAAPAQDGARRPAVLVSHAWAGQGSFERERAKALAELGYVGFAIDVYGKGRRGSSIEENSRLMTPFVEDRALLRRRLLAAAAAAAGHPLVDGGRLGAIGFCFGGLCVLDLARAAAPGLRGVVSFHGLLMPPGLGPQGRIAAKALVLHPYDDPMAPPESVATFAREFTEAGSDWQVHMYGHTTHAFTNPEANDPGRGLLYNATAARRAYAAAELFLRECLG